MCKTRACSDDLYGMNPGRSSGTWDVTRYLFLGNVPGERQAKSLCNSEGSGPYLTKDRTSCGLLFQAEFLCLRCAWNLQPRVSYELLSARVLSGTFAAIFKNHAVNRKCITTVSFLTNVKRPWVYWILKRGARKYFEDYNLFGLLDQYNILTSALVTLNCGIAFIRCFYHVSKLFEQYLFELGSIEDTIMLTEQEVES
uniref:Uncharacterized protein n=1 Tax=Coccidioides posadasii RMSCC 3488 TaxID=454284 RepID=A0A0J6FDY9_COCPO|nr:hypothetical protein CPAG_07628 [Coccidioides posadasii RMSCC 3488]